MASDSSGLDEQVRTFDVYDPQLQEQDLHPFFDELRSKCPVARTDVPGGDGPLYLVWAMRPSRRVVRTIARPAPSRHARSTTARQQFRHRAGIDAGDIYTHSRS